MGRFFSGDLIEVFIDDGKGSTKSRPAIIIFAGDPRIPDDDLRVVAVTSSVENPCPPYHIVVPMMSVASVVKCNWIRDVHPQRVVRRVGTVGNTFLVLVLDTVEQLIDDVNFDDWV